MSDGGGSAAARACRPRNIRTGWRRSCPTFPATAAPDWLEPGIVTDPADGRLAHLDGLNLSPRLEPGCDRGGAAGRRHAPRVASGGVGGASTGRLGGGNRRALRRRGWRVSPLSGEFRRLSGHQTRAPLVMSRLRFHRRDKRCGRRERESARARWARDTSVRCRSMGRFAPGIGACLFRNLHELCFGETAPVPARSVQRGGMPGRHRRN
jgi:hypothetical protein